MAGTHAFDVVDNLLQLRLVQLLLLLPLLVLLQGRVLPLVHELLRVGLVLLLQTALLLGLERISWLVSISMIKLTEKQNNQAYHHSIQWWKCLLLLT